MPGGYVNPAMNNHLWEFHEY